MTAGKGENIECTNNMKMVKNADVTKHKLILETRR